MICGGVKERGNVVSHSAVSTSGTCARYDTYIGVQHGRHVDLVHGLFEPRMTPEMTPDDEPGEQLVLHWIDRILDHAQDVESGQDGFGEVDVLLERDRRVVPAPDRIRRGYDGTTGLQRRDDPSLADRDGLLFHGLVDRRPIGVVHLVEFVDQTDPLVGEDERTTLERPFLRDRVLAHRRRETDGRCSLTGGEDGPVRRLFYVFQKLRLGRPRISEQEDVDIPSDPMFAIDILGYPAKEGQGDGRLDILVTVDRGGDRFDDPFRDPLVLGQVANHPFVLFCQPERREQVFLFIDMVCLEHGRKDGETVLRIERSVEIVSIDPGHFLPGGVNANVIVSLQSSSLSHGRDPRRGYVPPLRPAWRNRSGPTTG